MPAATKADLCENKLHPPVGTNNTTPSSIDSDAFHLLAGMQITYQQLNPKYQKGDGLDLMTTAALVERLQEINNIYDDATPPPEDNLFKILNQKLLRQTLISIPSTHANALAKDSIANNIELSYKTFFNYFGGQIELRGSLANALLNTSNKNNAQKTSAAESTLSVNDVDVFIKVPDLSTKNTLERLAKIFRHNHPSSLVRYNRPSAKNIINEQLVRLYTRDRSTHNAKTTADSGDKDTSTKTPDFLKTFRISVDLRKSFPIDLNFYTRLPADFDRLGAGSDCITLNLNKQTALRTNIIDYRSKQWLDQEKYIWFHDGMDGGLNRIRKHFSNEQHWRLLQPTVVGTHYERASIKDRVAFLKWVLDNTSAVPFNSEPLTDCLNQVADKFSKLPPRDTFERDMQDNLLTFWKADAQADQFTHITPQSGTTHGLKKCLDIFSAFREFFFAKLEQNPDLLPSAQQIDALFALPTVAELRDAWDKLGPRNPQRLPQRSLKTLRTILEPITLSVLGDRIFSSTDKAHANTHDISEMLELLSQVAAQQVNTQQQVIVKSMKVQVADSASEKRSAIKSLIKLLEKLGENLDILSPHLITALNTLSPLALEKQQRKFLKSIVIESIKNTSSLTLQNHTQLNDAAKSLLLFWQAQASLNTLNTFISKAELNPPESPQVSDTTIFENIYCIFGKIDQYEQKAQRFRKALSALAAIPNNSKAQSQVISLQIAPKINAIAFDSGDVCALVTDDYIHIGKFSTNKRKNKVTFKDEGLRWNTHGVLQFGKINSEGELEGEVGLLTREIAFSGEVTDKTIGAGALMPRNPISFLPGLKPFHTVLEKLRQLKPKHHDTTQVRGGADHSPARLYMMLKGSLQGCHLDDFHTLTARNFSLDNVYLKGSANTLFYQREIGQHTRATITKYEGLEHQQLLLAIEHQHDDTIDINFDDTTIIDGSKNISVTGSMDPETFKIDGHGVIESIPDRRTIYAGELINFTRHGFGKYYPQGLTQSTNVYYENDVIIDRDYQAFVNTSSLDILADHDRPTSAVPYLLPMYSEKSLFSQMDDEGNKVWGLWINGLIVGGMRIHNQNGYRQFNGQFISMPDEVCQQATLNGFSIGDDVMVVIDIAGAQHRIMPVGNLDVLTATNHDTPNNSITANSALNDTVGSVGSVGSVVLNTVTVGYALGQPLPEPFTMQDANHISTPTRQDDPSHRVVITQEGYIKEVYIGDVKIKETEQGHVYYIPNGKGFSIREGEFTSGTFTDGILAGKAKTIDRSGQQFKGHFAEGRAKLGTLTLPNGVTLFSSFKNDQCDGSTRVSIPGYPTTRTFDFKIEDGHITNPNALMEVLPDGTRIPASLPALNAGAQKYHWRILINKVLVESKKSADQAAARSNGQPIAKSPEYLNLLAQTLAEANAEINA